MSNPRDIRTHAGVSQTAIAEAVGVTQPLVSQFENGVIDSRSELGQRMSRAYAAIEREVTETELAAMIRTLSGAQSGHMVRKMINDMRLQYLRHIRVLKEEAAREAQRKVDERYALANGPSEWEKPYPHDDDHIDENEPL